MNFSCRIDIGRCNVITSAVSKYLLVFLIFREPLPFLDFLSRAYIYSYSTTDSLVLRSSRSDWHINSQSPRGFFLPVTSLCLPLAERRENTADAPYLFLSMPRDTGYLHAEHVHENTVLGLSRLNSILAVMATSDLPSEVVFGLR